MWMKRLKEWGLSGGIMTLLSQIKSLTVHT